MAKQRIVINIRDSSGEQELARARGTVACWLVGLALLMVYFCGMFPFDFSVGFGGVFSELHDRFDFSTKELWTTYESQEKFIFYMPLGFALGSLFWIWRGKWTRDLIVRCAVSICVAAAVATSVEMLQVFLSRDPSLADIIAKTTGSAAGFVIFALLGEPVVRWIARQFMAVRKLSDPRIFAGAAGIWLLAAALAPVAVRDLGSLDSWEPAYPMLIGNDTDGVRHWDGTVSNVWLTASGLGDDQIENVLTAPDPRAILGGPLLMAFHLDGVGPYTDSTGTTGNLNWTPNYERGAVPNTTQPSDLTGPAAIGRVGVPISEGWWLSTTQGAAAKASGQISQTNAFTLVMDLAMHDLDHGFGWPRIFSISKNAMACNVQLLQDHQDLQIRLRSQATGNGGFDPELDVPGIFTDTLPQRLLVTYDHGRLSVQTNRSGDRFSLKLMPDAWLVWRVFPSNFWHYRVGSSGQLVARGLYRVGAMLPLGMLLGAMLRVLSRRGRSGEIPRVFVGGICVSVVVLEATLHFAAGTPVSIGLPIVGVAAGIAGTMITGGYPRRIGGRG